MTSASSLFPFLLSLAGNRGAFFLSLFFLNNFTYLRLCWVVIVAQAFLQLKCSGLSLYLLQLLQSTGSRVHGLQQLQHLGSAVMAPGLYSTGLVAVAHGLSCSAACGIFSDQGSNPCLLHWQADSLPLSHQGSPERCFLDQIATNTTAPRVKWGSNSMTIHQGTSVRQELPHTSHSVLLRASSVSVFSHV